MNTLYYDCFAGISGDMNVGAMLDLGVEVNYLKNELKKLNLEHEYKIEILKDSKNGIFGTKFNVHYEHINHHHDEHHHHEHRNINDIEKIINNNDLSLTVKTLSINIFKRIALAEGKIHNKPIEEVHFHEVGAIDSIIDVVGSAICFDFLKIDKVISTPIQLGGGFIKCQHGIIPVPAPATLEILKGIPISTNLIKHEATTPTGAAILAELVNEFTYLKDSKIKKIGYGIGGRDVEIPNVLRVCIIE